MYIPKYFTVDELIPQAFPKREPWFVFSILFDVRLLRLADYLRSHYGPMVVNDYQWGGKNQERGLRLMGSETGAAYSQHCYGRGIDLVPTQIAVEKLRAELIRRQNSDMIRDIGAIELGVPWLHMDLRQRIVRHEIFTFTR